MFGIHRLRADPWARHQRRRGPRLWALEGLEDRVVLSPTLYTVNVITDTDTGSGTVGDLRYVINQANANTNPDGSLIQFDPAVFDVPQTITLSASLGPLYLSEQSGPEVISGPGATLMKVSGHNAIRVFGVDPGVTATLAGLIISGGNAYSGGGLYNAGSLTVSSSTLVNNYNGPRQG
jgi:hypothetical protein